MGCSRAIPFSEVVHFGADQVHWEYARLLTCESLLDSFGVEQPVAWNKSGICNTSSRPPIENVYIFWSHFVESYSAAELTVQSDRSIAISGHLMALKSCDYICGLWRSSFIQELIWCCHLPRARTDNRIPSWSWISIYLVALNRSPVYAMLSDRQPIAELVNISTSPCGDPFSPVSSAHATIRGPLLEALIPSMGFIQVGQDSLGACESWTLLLDEEHREHILGSTVYILLGGGASQQDSPQRLKGDSRFKKQWKPFYPVEQYDCLVSMRVEDSGYLRHVGYLEFGGDTFFDFRELDTSDCRKLLDRHFCSDNIPFMKPDENFMYETTLV